MMAKISVVTVGRNRHVTLEGRVTAADLGRLERACGSALEHKIPPLEVNIERVRSIDAAAQSYVDRLSTRGARITGNIAVLSTDVVLRRAPRPGRSDAEPRLVSDRRDRRYPS